MRSISSLKQEFLKKWIWGLRKYCSQKKSMNLLERKKAIKLSADLAMASTRNKSTRWSRALIANASRDDNNKVLAEHMIGLSQQQHWQRVRKSFTNRRIKNRNILRRNRSVHRPKDRVMASFIAKKLVQKRTRRLKSLIPGGEFMDDLSLIKETLDYMQSLRAQVEVMSYK
ncbi:transcription factor IBH1-like 1 isoform X2 [Abrus precatorius]|uniref:Transcription factor IBH1-like 1 isoform X2 n=1 Tax=Abrus precatorius TaxID=3816 RepID=A0A8B8JMB2_ABRPR|nr:transcription factor IBH1-like 1 isoform X2 [Abrus precatorius]